jgi:hypothetical protein
MTVAAHQQRESLAMDFQNRCIRGFGEQIQPTGRNELAELFTPPTEKNGRKWLGCHG